MTYDIIYGPHAIQTLLEHDPIRLLEVWVDNRNEGRLASILAELHALGIPVQRVQRKTLDDKAKGMHHHGILAKAKAAPRLTEQDLTALLNKTAEPFLLILDGVTDPHNLGACLRSAEAAGVTAVIVPKDNAVGLTPIVHKVASGAAEVLPFIQVTNLARTLTQLKDAGIWIVGTAGEASVPLYQAPLTGKLALVMGAEDKGLRRLTREHCDQLVTIPMAGKVSSLNVSVATGVALFEAVRQRGF